MNAAAKREQASADPEYFGFLSGVLGVNDPVQVHLDTRTEAEIRWHISFLPGTRQRLLRRPVTPSRPELTPEQIDIAVMRAERELATYRLALMLIEQMPARERTEREQRASMCVTTWSAAFQRHHPTPGPGVFEPLQERPEYSDCTVRA